MADQRISQLDPIGTIALGDLFAIVDIDDNTQGPGGSTKRGTFQQIADRLLLEDFLQGVGVDGQVGVFDGSGQLQGQTGLLFDITGLTVAGDVDITGEFKINGVPLNLVPTGTANTVAIFDGAGDLASGTLLWDGATFEVPGDIDITGDYLVNGVPLSLTPTGTPTKLAYFDALGDLSDITNVSYNSANGRVTFTDIGGTSPLFFDSSGGSGSWFINGGAGRSFMIMNGADGTETYRIDSGLGASAGAQITAPSLEQIGNLELVGTLSVSDTGTFLSNVEMLDTRIDLRYGSGSFVDNIAIGRSTGSALVKGNGRQNTMVGGIITKVSTGRQNTLIGYAAGNNISSANENTIVGALTTAKNSFGNTLLGAAMASTTIGSNNIAIGRRVSLLASSYQICIGAYVTSRGGRRVTLGNNKRSNFTDNLVVDAMGVLNLRTVDDNDVIGGDGSSYVMFWDRDNDIGGTPRQIFRVGTELGAVDPLTMTLQNILTDQAVRLKTGGGVDALKFYDGTTEETVWHSGNLTGALQTAEITIVDPDFTGGAVTNTLVAAPGAGIIITSIAQEVMVDKSSTTGTIKVGLRYDNATDISPVLTLGPTDNVEYGKGEKIPYVSPTGNPDPRNQAVVLVLDDTTAEATTGTYTFRFFYQEFDTN